MTTMKDLNSNELIDISGGGMSDAGEWLINKIGDLFCECKSWFDGVKFSNLKYYSHGTYPCNLN